MSSDEGGIFNTTAAMTRFSLAIPPGENVHQGKDGGYYSVRELLPSVLGLPTYIAGLVVEVTRPFGDAPVALGPASFSAKGFHGSNWSVFLTISVVGPIAIALTLRMLYRFVLLEGGSTRLAVSTVFLAGLTTPLLVYSKTIFPQVFESACLMGAFLAARRWREKPGLRVALQLGIACGLGFLTRTMFAPVAFCFGIYLLTVDSVPSRKMRMGAILSFASPLLVAVLLTFGFNYLKWGSILNFGRAGHEQFTTNLFDGVYGLLLSPGKGLFWYAPICWLAVARWRKIQSSGSPEFVLALVLTAIYLVVYGQWYDWFGGLCWGPRFVVPLIAPWVALIARSLHGSWSTWLRVSVGLLALVGGAISFAGAAVFPHWVDEFNPDPFSLSNSHLWLTLQIAVKQGADDFWITNPLHADSGGLLGVAILVSLMLVGLWRFATQPSDVKEMSLSDS